MKRKFLAKAITLGLMLAVPFSAYAEEIPPYAQGVMISNVDGKTAADVSGDMKVSLDVPTKNFANIHSGSNYIVGIGNITGENDITMNSAHITNNNFVNSAGATEIVGMLAFNGTTTVNDDVNIKLSGQNEKADASFGIFGIRTFNPTKYNDATAEYEGNSDGKVSKINIKGLTQIDISGKAKYLSGILFQDGDGTELTLGENTNIKVTDTSGNESVNAWGAQLTSKSNVKAGNINIEINGAQEQVGFKGFGNYDINDLKIKLNNASKKADGFLAGGWNQISDFRIHGDVVVDIVSNSDDDAFAANGVFMRSVATNDEQIIFDKALNVNVDAKTGTVAGIDVGYESTAEILLNEANVSIKGGKNIIGVRTGGTTEKTTAQKINISISGNENTEEVTGLNVKEKDTEIGDLSIKINNVESVDSSKIVGLRLSNNNYTKISGDVVIDVDTGYAIKTGYWNDQQYLNLGLILGSDDSKKVQVKGDILGSEGGDGAIKLNLTNSDSYFTGTNTGKTDITLKDGATWTNTGESTVSSLDVKDATLVQGSADATIKKSSSNDMRGSDQKFTISGNNTIALNTTSDGSIMSAGTPFLAEDLFNTVADDTKINLTSANQNAADVSKEDSLASFDKLAEALSTQLQGKVKTAHLDGSYTKNAIDAEVGSDGKFASGVVTQSDADTDTVAAIKKLPSINLVSWRTENNELSKRLGEVRDYDGEEGIWVRMNHGESKYLDSFETKGHLYQMGYDKKVGEWRLGGAVSYNKGTTTYENGNGKNRSTSLALYGAWFGDKGHYADIIVKEGKQKSELTIGQAGLAASNLDYNLWATSISAEYGRKIALKSDWFVEPQAELTYGRLGSADYGDNGFTVHQDSMDSLVGRMGFRLGKNLSDTSNIYMKASVLHEFCGDVDYSFTEGTNSKVSSVDLGDTWYEVGVGGSAQIGKATYAYAGIEKTFGGDFSTPWQWNAGVRWSF